MLNQHIQTAYPQALSILIGLTGDVSQAEDSLQSAVEKALVVWKEDCPENRVAWLVKVARNKYLDHLRRQQKQTVWDAIEEPSNLPDLTEQSLVESYNDDLLRLIFTCCHPALDQATQIALALKHLLGLTVSEIANALLVSTKTMEQRLTRAKQKIAKAGIVYQTPKPADWPERLNGVLKTVYLLFNEGYLSSQESDLLRVDLCKEAIRLARLLNSCVREEPEVQGLLALLLHQHARSDARLDAEGKIVLLPQQDRSRWCRLSIQEANSLVEKALRKGKGTPYAIQAAIAALHNDANDKDNTDWQQICGLYQVLLRLEDTPIVRLNAAIALAKSGQSALGIKQVIELESQLSGYRYYQTVLAGLYFDCGQYQLAKSHYQLALEGTLNPVERQFIDDRISQLSVKDK